MTTYEVRAAGSIKMGVKLRLIAVLLFAGTLFLFRLWAPFGYERHLGRTGSALDIAISSIAFGILMSFRPTRLPGYTLLMDDDSITGISQYSGYMKWLVTRRKVRRGRVRAIFEIRTTRYWSAGIGVSERSQFAARMLGFVYIPKTLPEFHQLKERVESWRRFG